MLDGTGLDWTERDGTGRDYVRLGHFGGLLLFGLFVWRLCRLLSSDHDHHYHGRRGTSLSSLNS